MKAKERTIERTFLNGDPLKFNQNKVSNFKVTAANGDKYYIYFQFGEPFRFELNGVLIFRGWLEECVEYANRLAAYTVWLENRTWRGCELEAKGMCRVWHLEKAWGGNWGWLL